MVAGHGAGDSGATGNGYKEADMTRKIVAALNSKVNGVSVYVYDTSKNLYRSKEYSKFTKNDEVVEIHLNSFNGNAKGTEVLIKEGFSADKLDNSILNALVKHFTNRGIKKRSNLGNMNNFASRGISYRLVEVCFIDNASDMKVLTDNFDAIMTDLASAIVSAMGGSTSSSGAGNSSNNNGSSSSGSGSSNAGLPDLSGYQGSSIVDGLKSVGYDSSLSSRKALAVKLGISNYTGTASQNTQMLNLLKKGNGSSGNSSAGLPDLSGYKGSSIVDGLKSVGYDSSLSSRKELAAKLGINNYTGTASQNTKMLNALK